VTVLVVLLVSWAAFRAAGALGAAPMRSWRCSARWALALMLLFTASAHFTSMRHDLARMVPDVIPAPLAVVYLTGVLEFAGAIGLLLPKTRRLAGICLCLLFIAMFPANVKADREGLSIGGSAATPLALRLPMQVFLVWMAWWSSQDSFRRGREDPAHV